MTKESLKNIIERKNFKTFWHCYEFLTTASYTPIEAFSASIEHFGIDKMFDKVAFFRRGEDMWIAHNIYNNPYEVPAKLFIGVINPENEHLGEVYKIYNKRYNEGNVGVQRDVEGTCEIIRITEITPFIMDVVLGKMFEHFGIDELASFKKVIQPIPANPHPNNINQNVRRFSDLARPDIASPPHLPYNPIQPREDNIKFLYPNNNGDNNRA